MPDTTIGTTLPVARPELDKPANIEQAFVDFYEGQSGAGQVGVEYYLINHGTRITALESSLVFDTFPSSSFKVTNGTYYISFNLASLTANTSIVVPNQNPLTLVGTTTTQTLQNKTLDNTNALNVKDGSVIIENSTTAAKKFRFDASALPSATAVLQIPSLTGTEVLVMATLSQTVTKKNLVGYTEGVQTTLISTSSAVTSTIDCTATNYVNHTWGASGTGAWTVTFSNLPSNSKDYPILITMINLSSGSRTVNLPSGIKWAGGSGIPSNTVGAGKRVRVALDYEVDSGGTTSWYGSYLGEYS